MESGWNDVLRYSVVSGSLQCHRLYVACQTPQCMGFFWQEYWSGVPFPLSRDLPNSVIKLDSLVSPALAGRFFTTNATWEAHIKDRGKIFCSIPQQLFRDREALLYGSLVGEYSGSVGKQANRGTAASIFWTVFTWPIAWNKVEICREMTTRVVLLLLQLYNYCQFIEDLRFILFSA